MAGDNIGEAFVQVSAETSGFGDQVVSAAQDAGDSAASAFSTAFGSAFTDIPPVDVPVTADTTEAQTALAALPGDAGPVDVPVSADTSEAVASIASLPADVPPVDITVTADTSDAQSNIDSLDTSLQNTSSNLDATGQSATDAGGGLGTFRDAAAGAGGEALGASAGILGVGLGLGAIAHVAIDAATAQQQFNQTFTLFADAANKVNIPGISGTYTKLGESIGVAAGEMQHSLVIAFQLATNVIGLSGLAAIDYSKNVVDIAVNLKSLGLATGSVDDITKRLSISLEGGSTRLARMGVHISDSAANAQVMANQLSGVNDELGLTDNKAKLAFARVQIYTFEAGNSIQHNIEDKAKQSQTQVDKLRVAFEGFTAKAVVPYAVPILDKLSEVIPQVMDTFPNLFQAIQNLGPGATEFAHRFTEAFGSVGSAVVTTIHTFNDFGSRFSSLAADMGHQAGQAASSIHDFLSTTVSTIADAGGSISGFFADVGHAVGQAASSIHDFASSATSAIADLGRSIGSGVSGAISSAVGAIGRLVGAIGGIAGKTVNIAVTGVEDAIGAVRTLISTVASLVGKTINIAESGAEAAAGAVGGLFDAVSGLFSKNIEVHQFGAEAAESAVKGVGAAVAGLPSSKSIFIDVSSNVSAVVAGVGAAINSVGGKATASGGSFTVPGFQSGGSADTREIGSWFTTGEEGPELMRIRPGGFDVLSNPQSRHVLAGGGGGGGDLSAAAAELRYAAAEHRYAASLLAAVSGLADSAPSRNILRRR